MSYSSGYGFTAPVNIGTNPDVTVGDVNGDGKADIISGGGIQFSNGSGFSAATPLGVTLGISSDLYIFSGDVSGDGKDDLITSQTNCDIRGTCSSNWRWALSNGSAFANLTVGGGVAVSSVGDVNGDGRADILVGNTILKSTGAGFLAAVVWSSSALSGARYLVDADGDGRQDLMTDNTFCNGYGSCSTSHALSSSNGASFGAPAGLGSELCGLGACLFGDVTGDGAPDLVRVGGGLATVRPMQRRTPHFLIRVTDGLNAVTEITYKPISDTTVYTPSSGSIYPIRDILPQSALNVVASSRSSDGLGGLYTLRYTYTGAKTHQQGGGLLGFASMVTYDDQKGTYAQTIFRQDWPYHGLPTQTYQRLYSGATLSATVNTWSANNTYARVYYPYVLRSVANAYELNQTLISQITTNAVVNSYGNTTRVEIISSDGHNKTNINTYGDNAASWILGRVTCSAVTNTLPNGASATRTSSFAYRADGLLNREVVEPDIGCAGAPAASTDPKLRVTTDYVYDAFGNKQSATTTSAVASTDSAYFAPRTSYTYFEAQGTNPAGRFPTRVVNAVGQTETHEFDPRFGTMTKLTGPNNVATTWTYDVFGRKATESRADGTSDIWSYNYVAPGPIAAYFINSNSTGTPATSGYFDRLNRQVRSYVTNFDGAKSNGDGVDFNALGQVTLRYRNYFTNATTFPGTSFTYDALGRLKTEIAADGSQATFTYSGFTTSVTRTTGRSTPSTITSTSVVNSQGQKLSITDAAGTITSYTYDPFGNLLTTNAGGVVTSMVYNLRGFKTSMNDPDMGVWSYQYSALGELKQQTDAKLLVTTMTYDLLGRLTNRSEPSLISNWYYDAYKGGGVCAGGRGKLCQVESNNGYNRAYTYDALGRGIEVAYTIDDVANPYRITTTYGVVGDTVCPNSQGKVCTVTYPAATVSGVTSRFAVRNEYNAVGYLAKIWRKDVILTKPYWTGTAMNADGNFTGDSMGASAADLTTVRDFDPLTGRLKAIKSGLASATAAQFNRYVYDHLGNVTERHDDNMNVHETFTLDALSRLTQMSMTGTTAQTKTYQYNAIGNLTYKSDLGTLTYPAIGSPRPHAVTSIAGNATGVLDGVTNGTYVYDANGNMSYSVVVDRIFTYTSFNLPSRIDNQNSLSDFIYDADHNRISESYVNGTIIFVALGHPINPGNVTFFERHKNFNQAGFEVYRFSVHTPSGATIFFSRQSNNGAQAVRFQLKDNLGSTVADVDATGNVVTRYSFDAFGKVRNPTGSATGGTISESRRGFTGHEHIKVGNSGLIHMNGRVYDATLGRFTTADPMIQAPSFSQSYNRYTYGFNNPLSGTDPSGFGFFDIASDFFSAHDDFVRNPFKVENFFALNHSIPGHGTIDHFMMTHEWARVAGRAAATFFAGWFGPWAAAGANAMITGYEVWLAGGSSQDIHKASAISFATSMAFNFVGDGAAAIAKGGNVAGGVAFKIVGHAAIGCASASASGGDCGQGALSAGFGAAASFAPVGGNVYAGFVVSTVAGGIGAELGGGKFINGAQTAAMGYLMNTLPHLIRGLQMLYYRAAPHAQTAATFAEALMLTLTGTPSPTLVLMPSGNAVGWAAGGAGNGIQTVGRQEFDAIVGSLLNHSTEVAKSNFPGRWFNLQNGAGSWGMRLSDESGLTLQLKIDGVTFNKLHYYQDKADLIPK